MNPMQRSKPRSRPTQIDPPGCGCTECLTGEYVPLSTATHEQVHAMLNGKLNNATSEEFCVSFTAMSDYPQLNWILEEVTAKHSGLSWTFSND